MRAPVARRQAADRRELAVTDLACLSRPLEPGMFVTTDFSGRVTRHQIVSTKRGQSQTGVLVQVKPEVPKSGGIEAWIDSAWFTAEGAPVQAGLF